MQQKMVAFPVLAALVMIAFSAQGQVPVEIFEAPSAQQGYQLSELGQSAAPGQGASGQQASSSVLGRGQRVAGLSGRTQGTIYSISADNAGQITIFINGQPSGPFTLPLPSGGQNQGIFELLLYSFDHDQAVNIGYGLGQEIIDVQIRK